MPPNMPAAIGREAIKSRYQGFFDNPPPDSIRMERLEVIGDSADWMVDPEKLLILITNSNDNYKHLTVFLRDQNKSWKIAHLIWNSNSR
jgi:ketosteroid isomerase-like protein